MPFILAGIDIMMFALLLRLYSSVLDKLPMSVFGVGLIVGITGVLMMVVANIIKKIE